MKFFFNFNKKKLLTGADNWLETKKTFNFNSTFISDRLYFDGGTNYVCKQKKGLRMGWEI